MPTAGNGKFLLRTRSVVRAESRQLDRRIVHMLNRIASLSAVAALAVALSAPVPASAGERSARWETVNFEELKKLDEWRRASPTAFAKVSLDMNNDGLKDEATLVIDRGRHHSGLRVCLGRKEPRSPSNCHILVDDDLEDAYDVMGLNVRAPGCHLYNTMNDLVDAGGRICSRAQALEYYRVGSATSFFLYDQKTGRFNRYWDSD